MAIVHNNLLHILQRSEEKSTKDPDIKEWSGAGNASHPVVIRDVHACVEPH
jgi:hypothetical protein